MLLEFELGALCLPSRWCNNTRAMPSPHHPFSFSYFLDRVPHCFPWANAFHLAGFTGVYEPPGLNISFLWKGAQWIFAEFNEEQNSERITKGTQKHSPFMLVYLLRGGQNLQGPKLPLKHHITISAPPQPCRGAKTQCHSFGQPEWSKKDSSYFWERRTSKQVSKP
jgi:hypothetical protein